MSGRKRTEQATAMGTATLALIALLACKSSSESGSGTSSTPGTGEAKPSGSDSKGASASATPASAKVGDTVTFDDSKWVILSAKNSGKALKSVLGNKKTDGRFITVQFKVTNTTKEEERIMDHPKVVDDQAREFGPLDDQSTYLPEEAKSMSLEQLPPSMTKEFWAIYEVPADAKGLKFQARALGAFGDKKAVDLGL